MKYAWAVPGAKVVCVDDANTNSDDIKEIERGRVYVIAEVVLVLGIVCLRLEGVKRVDPADFRRVVSDFPGVSPDDLPFRADRFRPLISRTQEQDVAMFTRLLDQNSIQVSEDA